jgi:AcrR family transcriptional regulator
MPNRTRARTADARHERRNTFLATAVELFDERPYEAITMSEVAERTGLAKGTAYLYFDSKEDLFLTVAEEQLREWFDALDAWLEAAGDTCEPAALADAVADSLARRPTLPRLLAILHVTFEHNIGHARARAFKLSVRERFATTAGLLERRVPALAAGDGVRLLMRLHALVIGLQHIAEPAPVVRDVLAESGMEVFRVDFAGELAGALRVLLGGDWHEVAAA